MARETVLEMNRGRYSEKIIDIVYLFNEIGWKYYDIEKNVEHLSIGDKDGFNWKKAKISEYKLQELINRKQNDSEIIGLILHYKNSQEGLALLAENTRNIKVSLNINRRTIGNNGQSITDIAWYFNNVVRKLDERGCPIDYFQIIL